MRSTEKALESFYFYGVPVAKPRMTRRDKWAKRGCVQDYFAFRDEVKSWATRTDFELKPGDSITFRLPMAKSWSKSKKEAMNEMPHQNKPDLDNLIKGLLDALLEEDQAVWHLGATQKLWSEEGQIEIRREE